MKSPQHNAPEEGAWRLAPLTPEYIQREHGCYVAAINDAIKNQGVRNIALSGNYGVGKSSILAEVANQHRDHVVELSLSTLAPMEASNFDESVPKQATTPTNRIQQEIVKQLLYREEPKKTPGSRFQRIERFSWPREVGIAALIGILATAIFLLAGWTEKIGTDLLSVGEVGIWTHLAVWGLALILVLSGRYLTYGRLHVSRVSAGSATVTLDEKSASYFDQYLDEIVYFFEVSKRDIVIFEDIDRFDDSYIFETLRSLNTLLNSSPKRSTTPIRFVYAIKDSIFDQLGTKKEGGKGQRSSLVFDDPAQAEAVRANRTKFFDLVIPVVPFINHRTARDIASQLLAGIEHRVDEDLIDLASRYIPDMRLLKNVRNEFVVFRDRIFSGSGEQLKLSETELFAMMLYKSTHLSDFEEIRIGKSKLDEIYDNFRTVVLNSIADFDKRIRDVHLRLSKVNGVPKKSAFLGRKLIAHIDRTVRSANFHCNNERITFDGKKFNRDYIESEEFWKKLAEAPDNSELIWSSQDSYGRKILRFVKSDIEGVLNTRIDRDDWDEAYRSELEDEISQLRDKVNFLRSADMGDILKNPDMLVDVKDSKKSFEAIVSDLLSRGLAYHLIRSGYINRNFTLYTSTFHGDRVSAAATNFIVHHVERNSMDEYFELDNEDVKSVIRECGGKSLKEPALYNVAILDYLLRNDVYKADIMLASVVRFGVEEERFLQAYLSSANETTLFTKRFVKLTSKALSYLVDQVDLDDHSRINLISVALGALSSKLKYQADSSVAEFLKSNYEKLPVLKSTSIARSEVERISEIFLKTRTVVSSLEPLSPIVKEVFIENSLYEINLDNLKFVLGSDSKLSLDNVLVEDESVYRYILSDLDSYLLAVDGVSVTVESEENFVDVINDVIGGDAEEFSRFVEGVAGSCVVADIEDVSEDAWPVLALYKRFPSTFSNINSYISLIGGVDENLAKVLTYSEAIVEQESEEDSDKVRVAIKILSAKDHLPSPYLRASLVGSLNLNGCLHAEDIPLENGELFALLLERRIVEDSEETFSHLADADWPTRERFIQSSTHFKNFVSPDLMGDDFTKFLLSENIDLEVKLAVVNQADQYAEHFSQGDLAQLAEFSLDNNCPVSFNVVARMANGGVDNHYVIALLEPYLDEMPLERLSEILEVLDGDYPQLTSVGADVPKVIDAPPNVALIEKLKSHGIVSKYNSDGKVIKVYKKRK